MKANELRIGNLIYSPAGVEKYVFGTSYKTILYTSHLENSTYNEAYDYECEPIPLTEEWLYNFGFSVRKESSNFYSFGYGQNPITKDWMLLLKYFEDENRFFFMNGHHTIKYVHQLQNLYFALTNNELEIL